MAVQFYNALGTVTLLDFQLKGLTKKNPHKYITQAHRQQCGEIARGKGRRGG